ncbi:MAG TPA: MFS transporter [Trebonia sp.]|jgi:ACS family glucarate transporter-like MFS transporter
MKNSDFTERPVVPAPSRRVPVYSVILFLIFLSTLITYCDRVNISYLLPYFHAHFGWNDAQLGLLSSTFFIGYTIFQIPAGLLADKFGGKRTLLVGSLWWSVFTIVSAAGTTIPLMGAIRALMGSGEAANFPSDTHLTRHWAPQSLRSRATGANLSAIALGPLIATPITVWLLDSYGWRSVFYFYGGVGLLWTVAWAWYGRSRPAEHPAVSREELATITAAEPSVAAERLDSPLRSRQVWGLTLSYFFLLYSFYLVLTLLPTYLVQARHFSTGSLALTATIPYAVAFITMNCSGFLIDRLIRRGWAVGTARRALIYIGLAGTAVFTALEAIAPGAGLAVALLSIALGFTGLCFSPYWALPIDYSPGSPGLVSGMLNTSGNIAGIVAPAVTGAIVTATGSWDVALFISAALSVAGVVVLGTFSRRLPAGVRAPQPAAAPTAADDGYQSGT